MANPTEPATSPIFRALRSVDVDPDLAYEAAEASRLQAGENVIAAIGAQITELKAELGSQITEVKAELDTRLTRIEAEIKAQGARIDAQTSRIDDMRQTVWRVIWPLIVHWPFPSSAFSTGFLLPPLGRRGYFGAVSCVTSMYAGAKPYRQSKFSCTTFAQPLNP